MISMLTCTAHLFLRALESVATHCLVKALDFTLRGPPQLEATMCDFKLANNYY